MAAPDSDRQAAPAPLKNHLVLCTLLLLGEKPAYGYELLARLPEVGFSSPHRNGRYAHSGALYRVLHTLESDGMVSATPRGRSGAARRRIYELTPAGREDLGRRAQAAADSAERIDAFMSRYETSPVAGLARPARRISSLVARAMVRNPLEELDPRRRYRPRNKSRRPTGHA